MLPGPVDPSEQDHHRIAASAQGPPSSEHLRTSDDFDHRTRPPSICTPYSAGLDRQGPVARRRGSTLAHAHAHDPPIGPTPYLGHLFLSSPDSSNLRLLLSLRLLLPAYDCSRHLCPHPRSTWSTPPSLFTIVSCSGFAFLTAARPPNAGGRTPLLGSPPPDDAASNPRSSSMQPSPFQPDDSVVVVPINAICWGFL